jgi:hypothetical protein
MSSAIDDDDFGTVRLHEDKIAAINAHIIERGRGRQGDDPVLYAKPVAVLT